MQYLMHLPFTSPSPSPPAQAAYSQSPLIPGPPPVYSPDMPKRLPLGDILSGLLGSVATAVRFWLHYTLVAFAWLGIVPLTACRIYRCLFAGSVNSILSLPLDMLST